jgi:hypothetical protein
MSSDTLGLAGSEAGCFDAVEHQVGTFALRNARTYRANRRPGAHPRSPAAGRCDMRGSCVTATSRTGVANDVVSGE